VTRQANVISKLSKRQRRAVIAAFVTLPLFYPFLLVWFAHGQLDEVYRGARPFPEQWRSTAPLAEQCAATLTELSERAYRAREDCVSAMPKGDRDTLKSLRVVEKLELPLIQRGVDVWGALGEGCEVLGFLEVAPEERCPTAREELHAAAAELDAALARYADTRVLVHVILYLWLIAEVLAWAVVLWLARRYLRERAAANA
jgi:hypothetical protein